MQDSKRPALSRTWRVTTVYREASVVVDIGRNEVTLSRDIIGGPLSASFNGQACEVARALNLLRHAERVELVSETFPTIGKARAAKLHRVLGRLGLPSSNHYGLAAAALCEPFPLASLASLTEQEARRVWAHVCQLYPQARMLAA